MSQESTMVKLFEKLDDLKSVFVYGQKIIPVIHSLIDFMRDTVPLLENINKSIAESTNKIPKAKHHINDVTNATELATTEILDLVDTISDDLGSVEKQIHELQSRELKQISAIDDIINLVNNNPEAQLKLKELKENLNAETLISNALTNISKVKNDAYNITISLQVQDITSQQLAAVNHLIESVQDKLSSLISNLSESEIKELTKGDSNGFENVAFDPEASYNKETSRQDMADTLVNENYNTSQEEIDKLFS